MLRSSILIPCVVATVVSAAQRPSLVYPTYDAYVNAKADTIGTYLDLVPLMGQYTLLFDASRGAAGGDMRKIPCKDIWGFTINDVLFRIEPDAHLPVRLMTRGAICYYENGPAHLIMQRDGTELGMFELGHQSYLSEDLEGPIVPAIFKADERSASNGFRSTHPQYEPLFTCIGEKDDINHTRQCVVDFEVSVEGE